MGLPCMSPDLHGEPVLVTGTSFESAITREHPVHDSLHRP